MKKNIISRYINDKGRIKIFPSKYQKKVLIIEYLASLFPKNMEYTEKEINLLIKEKIMLEDYILFRRYLVDLGHIGRMPNGSKYWIK